MPVPVLVVSVDPESELSLLRRPLALSIKFDIVAACCWWLVSMWWTIDWLFDTVVVHTYMPIYEVVVGDGYFGWDIVIGTNTGTLGHLTSPLVFSLFHLYSWMGVTWERRSG